MRITDLPVATPLSSATRPDAKKAESRTGAAPTLVSSGKSEGAQHPDEIAASALQKAASAAQASRVVAAENQRASDSVRGELDPARVLVG